ncbi:Cdc7p-Dbf4p kinase complex regulatory subunit [Coemansia sp. RSA 1822]|nr:Cdc7p-Dbf4p kinase complex regulatory subunit [Coemansia sp. RSA 638]KAJ2540198.1 Cdc7p-Dbf4p kinase complex regulatory subunit [Coemansia sp. RSA 1853]KAJ2566146.1 Cdc7p-Dbf4p kinase complex regulatory subunit [Coemansia sp. RSA 1822]
MASRKLTFDASRPAPTFGAGRSMHASNYMGSGTPGRPLATPTRPAQRATRAQHGMASPGYSPVTAQPKRNPLQAITNKEPNAVIERKTMQADTQLHTPVSAEQQREQKARLAEWIYAYRRAFPSFVFYFEGIDETTVQRLAIPIRNLGAKVETFFSAQTVTHVIVGHSDLISGENCGSNVVSLAKRFQLKIWDIVKLEKRVLGLLLPGYSATQMQGPSVQSAKRKLNEAFSAEKLYNMRHKTFEGTSVAHCVDFYYFKYVYVLVEDATHLHRPAIMEDYRPPDDGMEPPWPKLYMVPTGRCPFVQYEEPTTSSKSEDTDADDKENMTPEPMVPTPQLSKTPASRVCTPHRGAWTPAAGVDPEHVRKPFATVHGQTTGSQMVTPTRPPRNPADPVAPAGLGIIDSNASGIVQSLGVTSTSTAFNMNAADPVLQRNLLQNLNGGRVTHLSRLEQPSGPRGRAPPLPRTKKTRAPERRARAAPRPGYCENCRVKFDDMLEHVKTAQHRRFASNERNWVELDALLDRERRPVRRKPATPHLYALSSDDASQSACGAIDATSLHASGPAHSWGSAQDSAFASTHACVVDLTYSTNSSAASPKPICAFAKCATPANSANVLSETPQGRSSAQAQDKTLVASRKRPRCDAEHTLVTPTRTNDRVFEANDTLVQPVRVVPAKFADPANRSTARQDTAQRLCRMLHGDADSGSH